MTSLTDSLPPNSRCDFENGLCRWTNRTTPRDTSLLPAWFLHKGSTPTANTGPTVDHTYGTDDGSYLCMLCCQWQAGQS